MRQRSGYESRSHTGRGSRRWTSGQDPSTVDATAEPPSRSPVGGPSLRDPNEAVLGALLGCAVGDAVGLPYEGLSARRGRRLLGEPDRHRFLFRHGMVSDDTEHTAMVCQTLCRHPTDPEAFARSLGWRLRWWLLGLPAGIGLATLRATIKLWLGFPPGRSGVFSAGNGPAMRSAVLGAAIDDLGLLSRFVLASTRLTHTDPKAYEGAFAVALAAWCARHGIYDAGTFLDRLSTTLEKRLTPAFRERLEAMPVGLANNESIEAFARRSGSVRGVSGYVYHTVPVALYAWLRHPNDFQAAIAGVIRCGGDTDTVAAISGAIIASGTGIEGIPSDWLAGVREWPRSVAWMKRLARSTTEAMQSGRASKPPRVWPLAGLLRNGVFLVVVLCHAFRRLLPPY